ncbi:MAG: hypothetical protein EHM41_10695 [Chloroflexi bacterium]|nr:MAG: hypothetical protein EHM41_10695 [Chloroflexota bacterium]
MTSKTAALTSPQNIIVASIILAGAYGLYASSQYSYLLFHSFAEIFSIVIAVSIFLLSWNARRFLLNDYILFIGISQLFVGLIDILHTLSYRGMNIFLGYDSNLPTQLWIAARYWQSLSFLAAILFINRKLKPGYLFFSYTFILALLLASIFIWNIFPVSYMEGVGLTPFKINSEYVINIIFLCSLLGLLWKKERFSSVVLRWMILTIVTSMLSELAFTFYIGVYDFSNLAGHFLKIAAYYFLYKAIVETGLVKPYALLFRDLVQSEESLRSSRDELQRINDQLTEANKKLLEANQAIHAEMEVRQNAEARLVEYAARLESSNQELERFAFVASHDLQEPLRKIIAFGDLLKGKSVQGLNESEKGYLDRMISAASRMQKMIGDLLELSRVTTNGQPFEKVDLSHVVSEVVSDLEVRIQQAGGSVVVDELPVITADAIQIRQLMLNLIGNALKYHRPDVPPVVCIRGKVEQNGKEKAGQIRLEVEDNGIGFDMEYLEKIFEPFQRLHGRSEYEGSGIGLAVCKKIVERHQGELTAVSSPGSGSIFIITLPLNGIRREK